MKCVLCKNDSFEDIANVNARYSSKLRVSLCKGCGLIRQNPISTDEELEIYYSYNYYLDHKKVYTPKPKHIYRAGIISLQRLEFMKKAGISEGNLLDVGAGGGEFVYLSGKMGFKSQGIEPNIGYSEYAKAKYNCSLKTGKLNNVQGNYDVITMFHVLEHLPSPLRIFEKLYNLLNTNGVLFIEVPWIETNDASPHNIFFKAHIFYFSVDTLVACASKYFDVLKVDTTSNLKVLFRAKYTPSKLEIPNSVSAKNIRKRIKNKGWIEYLFKGKGALKPIKKILMSIEENNAKKYQPKEILDNLLSQK